MLVEVEPVLQENEFPPLTVKVALSPAQIETFAGEMDGVGIGFTFTVRDAVAVHPFASVTVTE